MIDLIRGIGMQNQFLRATGAHSLFIIENGATIAGICEGLFLLLIGMLSGRAIL
jgi:transcriptional regulator GlxA family with amidase domain